MGYSDEGYNPGLIREKATSNGGIWVRENPIATINYPPIKNPNEATNSLPPKSLGMDKLVINKIGINDYISSNIFISGTSGWRIHGNGDAELNNVVIRGDVEATTGRIGDWSITTDGIYYDGTGTPFIKTAAAVGAGLNGVIFDKDGIRGYDSVLGKTFDLHSDGTSPEFSFGTISESIFEINTNAILRTSVTVGDGSVSSAGILINDTGFYACEASQTLANANVKILIDGSATIKMNVKGGQTDFNTGTGYFLGLSGGDYKFSIGDQTTNYMTWDGTYLRLKGSFDVGTGGIINNSVYTVANLPIAPTSTAFLVPSAYE